MIAQAIQQTLADLQIHGIVIHQEQTRLFLCAPGPQLVARDQRRRPAGFLGGEQPLQAVAQITLADGFEQVRGKTQFAEAPRITTPPHRGQQYQAQLRMARFAAQLRSQLFTVHQCTHALRHTEHQREYSQGMTELVLAQRQTRCQRHDGRQRQQQRACQVPGQHRDTRRAHPRNDEDHQTLREGIGREQGDAQHPP